MNKKEEEEGVGVARPSKAETAAGGRDESRVSGLKKKSISLALRRHGEAKAATTTRAAAQLSLSSFLSHFCGPQAAPLPLLRRFTERSWNALCFTGVRQGRKGGASEKTKQTRFCV